jgi:hypothetical protein
MKALDLSWVGDYNTTVNRMYAQFGALKEKTHTTYRYLFDRNAEFVRFSNLSSKTARNIKNAELILILTDDYIFLQPISINNKIMKRL